MSEISQKTLLLQDLKAFKTLQKVIAIICIGIPAFLWISDDDNFYPNNPNLDALANIADCHTTINIDTTTDKSLLRNELQLTIKNCVRGAAIFQLTTIKKDRLKFRSSISHYAHSSTSYLFGMLYCIAAMLFIFNGIVYMQFITRQKLSNVINIQGPWYNLVIGFCLLMVVLNPIHDRKIPHYIFSALFFVGNIIVVAFFQNQNERPLTKTLRYGIAAIALVSVALPLIFEEIRKVFSILWGEWVSLTAIAIHLFLVARRINNLKSFESDN
jgi:hypothetical protein